MILKINKYVIKKKEKRKRNLLIEKNRRNYIILKVLNNQNMFF